MSGQEENGNGVGSIAFIPPHRHQSHPLCRTYVSGASKARQKYQAATER